MVPLIFAYLNVEILKWVDGDTVDLRVTKTHDFGFRFHQTAVFEDRFRLYGINTPERGQPGWAEATAHCNLMAPPGVAGVSIHTYKDNRDKYGRWLCEVFVLGESVNLSLVENGLAVEYLP